MPSTLLILREQGDQAQQEKPRTRRVGFLAGLLAPRTIRAKLARILTLALVLVLTLLGIGALQQYDRYRAAQQASGGVTLEVALQGLVHELQKERGLSCGVAGGNDRFRAQLPAQRQLTDAALAQVRAQVAGRQDAASRAVRTGLALVDGLPGVRRSTDSGQGQLVTVFDWFTRTNTALSHLDLGLGNSQDPALRAGVQTLLALGNAKESTGQQRALMMGSLPHGHFISDWYTRFAEARAARMAELDQAAQTATPAEAAALARVWQPGAARQVLAWERQAVGGAGHLDEDAIPADRWYADMTATINGLRTVQVAIGSDVVARADGLAAAAERAALLYAAVAVLAALVLISLAVGTARAVTGPLARLAREAAEVAGQRLPAAVAAVQAGGGEQPEPPRVRVPDRSGDEVRRVAEALDQVQRVAYDLATEQAVLRRNATDSLVSLGRRNQNLVRRQIGFINKLEHEDADPAQLANLFELDHLATRMRRNAESLLVLAGESSPRPWGTAIGVTDVIRAALSEVEEYRRVTLRRVDQVRVVGTVVAEVAHLLAELIENALSFSPPDMDVEIEGRRTSAGYLVAVVDHGLGMTPDALAEANVRLSGTASFMAEPTRFLGHFVVGALARRHGIEVRLGEAPAAGVVARVLLPNVLLEDAPVLESTSESRAELNRQQLQREIDAGTLPPSTAEELRRQVGPVVADAPALAALPRQSRTEPGTVTAAAGQAVAASAAPAPAGAGSRPVSAARTRNGLVKRPRRSAIASAVSEADDRWRAGDQRTPERSPQQVSAMLSSLRTAHERGAAAGRPAGSWNGSNEEKQS